jgi:cell wall-associated NlpC family hydrolase
MGRTWTRSRARTGRLVVATVLAVSSTVVLATVSSARPTHQDLVAAKAHLADLDRNLSLLVERYDQAKIALAATEQRLSDARARATQAQTDADLARREFSARASIAYEGAGSSLDVLLGATSYADFAARMEFVGTITREETDLANEADRTRVAARLATDQLARTVHDRSALLASLDGQKRQIQSAISDEQAQIDALERELAKPVVVNQLTKSPDPAPPAPDPSPAPDPGGGGPGPPPAPGAATAVAAAFSAIGVPYHWGGSDPSTGFDCSGLTMWAWAQAGVSLPHSSAEQYALIPHVDRGDLQPGDLLFFYTPISHVGMYVGGGMMIDAQHTGTVVSEHPVWWDYYVGAGRPG